MKITVKSGPLSVEIENGTAENVAELLRVVRDELNIPDGTTPLIDGVPANEGDALPEGDFELAFTKPVGQKGAALVIAIRRV